MGENQINNLFLDSIKNKELSKFLLGKGIYLVIDREYGNHWYYGSYKNYIEPCINKYFPIYFWEEINYLLKKYHDKNILLDALVCYFIPYYNCSDLELLNERTNETPKETIVLIKDYLTNNKEGLQLDKRGTGVEWNSKEGLFSSIVQNLQIIKVRGGPIFLPNEFI